MLVLVNTNRMSPPIAPIGLDYIAACAQKAGIEVEILDLGLTDKPDKAMKDYFSMNNPELIGVTFRNADDCFWPSADWFVPNLKDTVENIRSLTNAPIVLGGIGFSIFARTILEYTGVDFGICGDGEISTVELVKQLRGSRNFANVPGLLWRDKNKVSRASGPQMHGQDIHAAIIVENPPSWPDPVSLGTSRDFVDNKAYFKRGGQCGLETKRGCNRNCIYCADPLAKGTKLRLRNPSEVVDEIQSLLKQDINVLHICDSEFNLSRSHALEVCMEINRRSLGDKVRWYTYMSPSPFDAELAGQMAQAGCVGIDFTGDSACESMLRTYNQTHSRNNLADGVKLCRENGMAVMIDLLLGGPGETPQTVKETIDFIKKINPDCVGATLGMRIYPRTAMEKYVTEQEQRGNLEAIRRKYTGPLNLLIPTFYISEQLGEKPAELVKDFINGDRRFFEPAGEDSSDYNYNDNTPLINAIQNGARGAFWHILNKLNQAS
ncbi:MAG: radical SAM protein [Sedimentisphaerales bacterium]|nr:radical SAM protein [Sedimentisphaerales bacterium]